MKTKKLRQIIAVFTMLLAGAMFMSMTISDEWVVPAKYKNMKNPYKAKKDVDGIGKDLYKMHCASCHGKEGYGDGKKADNLDTPMRDFTSDEVQKQTDGELYYKSFVGRDEMPNFEKKIKAKEDRWFVVNYMRKLAK